MPKKSPHVMKSVLRKGRVSYAVVHGSLIVHVDTTTARHLASIVVLVGIVITPINRVAQLRALSDATAAELK